MPYVDLLSVRQPCVIVPLCASLLLYAALPHEPGAPFLIAAFPNGVLPGASTPLLPYVFLPGVSIQSGARVRAPYYVAVPILPIGLTLLAVSSRLLLWQLPPLASSVLILQRAFCFRLRSFLSLIEQARLPFVTLLSMRVPLIQPFS